MLAFVDASGRDFDVVDLISEPLAPEERGRFRVQLWAERVGPFIVRLLASSDCDAWSGLGLPEPLLAAPELRYLSAPRLASVTPRWTDLSSRDLSGFDLSRLLPVNPSPLPPSQTAIEAKLRGCDLRQTNLTGWVLDGADLRGVISDLGTRPSGASFVGARVSSRLNRRLLSWNGGLFQQQRGRPADLRGVIVED
ncbi:pentapeptide repeat-containing protein [Pseudenhygromyxa sp. WMMC2535]|nr:pentapeptide repeat-containing protein [Pseudenhygromyxa sp. WMMC2535]NVB36930.1 pentapeptide repeat-containing protein [Pseudenhygromyxa sp. WMMC2535]